jgi:hypothetical protein
MAVAVIGLVIDAIQNSASGGQVCWRCRWLTAPRCITLHPLSGRQISVTAPVRFCRSIPRLDQVLVDAGMQAVASVMGSGRGRLAGITAITSKYTGKLNDSERWRMVVTRMGHERSGGSTLSHASAGKQGSVIDRRWRGV